MVSFIFRPLFEVAMFSTIISALSSTFRNDFQLNFSGNVTQLGLMHTILGFFSLGRESMLVSAFRDAARIVAITATASSVTGFFSRGLSSLLFLLNISFHIYCVVIITGHLFTIKVLLKMIRHIVMKPMCFPLPPPFLVHTPTPEQTRTLVVAIGCEDALLKLFAFADLRRIAWTDLNRRLEVFSLSQPGGHPRNWSNVSTACFNILERIRDQIEMASTRIAAGNGLDKGAGDISEDEFEELDREMLMMPHKSRRQLYSSAVRQRRRACIKTVPRAEFVDHENITWLKNCLWSSSCQIVVVSRYDSNIAVLAIEIVWVLHTPDFLGLYMFAVQSYREDRYGVVLKDLPRIIGLMVQLIQAIDKFFRVRANQTPPLFAETNVKQIDSALQAGLLRINGTFGSHFGELNLTHEQLQTIRMVCQSDT
uniref:Nucleoporin protein Ndc1-Nup n=1 Tax=Angiostrongylus cantonensis TaxID=6313 RepID=A0A0K0DDZ3_ANGCA